LGENAGPYHSQSNETGVSHYLQPHAGGSPVPVRTNGVSGVPREGTGSRVLPARRQDAVLRGEPGAEFTALTSGSGTSRRPKPAFFSRSQCRGLGFARGCKFTSFIRRSRLTDDEGESAFRAELRLAHLIFLLPRL